jgi:glycosyltransferase involved in cell wall biosynthesis
MVLVGSSKLSNAEVGDSAVFRVPPTIAVVIPAFNHARFLAEAITSVLSQTRPADEIVVVDDGSTDDPASVVAQFPSVKLIRQDNRGVPAARNLGLNSCKANDVVCLDADDRLLPNALEAGLARITARPDCGFVYGGHRQVSEDGRPMSTDCIRPIEGDSLLALARRDLIGPPATVFFRRDRLLKVGGFDETLRRNEDYDLYLQLAERYPVANHLEIVAEYRKHAHNKSSDHVEMLKVELLVSRRHEVRIARDGGMRAAFGDYQRGVTKYRISKMLTYTFAQWRARRETEILVKDLIRAARLAPLFTLHWLLAALGRHANKSFSRPMARRI